VAGGDTLAPTCPVDTFNANYELSGSLERRADGPELRVLRSGNKSGSLGEAVLLGRGDEEVGCATSPRRRAARTERDPIRFTVYSSASVVPLLLTRGGALPDEYAA